VEIAPDAHQIVKVLMGEGLYGGDEIFNDWHGRAYSTEWMQSSSQLNKTAKVE
jgi:hypothetical protein